MIYFDLEFDHFCEVNNLYYYCFAFSTIFQVPWEMKAYTAYLYYTPEQGEFPEPGRPQPLGKREFIESEVF